MPAWEKTEMNVKTPTSLRSLSILALVEGASLVALIGIAMPLKYYAGLPEAVRVVGMAHGLLFLWATAMLFFVLARGHLSPLKGAGVFAASLIPFAGLWSHRMLVRSMRSHGQA
jgi:integral membrane protein